MLAMFVAAGQLIGNGSTAVSVCKPKPEPNADNFDAETTSHTQAVNARTITITNSSSNSDNGIVRLNRTNRRLNNDKSEVFMSDWDKVRVIKALYATPTTSQRRGDLSSYGQCRRFRDAVKAGQEPVFLDAVTATLIYNLAPPAAWGTSTHK
ncbi:hypothetical protein QIS74_09671 [Colletotrichum tabaci]|uniref:Uncharacterized protein n=1 Tax=Colletotrichum tabaci TaxID=1209068 RepID=A0AAV9T6P4_9PEZI